MKARLSAVVLDAPDPLALARFYQAVTGWAITAEEPDWVKLEPSDGGVGLSFQREPLYRRPVWPAVEGAQQMQLHLDIEVSDLDSAAQEAVALGAVEAEYQPQEGVRVLLDPAGHPFCLWVWGE